MRIPYLDECIVQDEHHGSGIPHPFPAVEKHLAKIADVSYFWMAQAKLPTRISKAWDTRKVPYQTIREVYRTNAATTTVKMRPGTSPRTE